MIIGAGKPCYRCGVAPRTINSYCHPCWSAHMGEYRRSNHAYRERSNAQQRERLRRFRAEARVIIHAAKAEPCAECGGTFHFAAMQFDHVRGEKRFVIGRFVQSEKSLDLLREEIAKCEVVCANCHAVRTWNQKKWPKLKEEVGVHGEEG